MATKKATANPTTAEFAAKMAAAAASLATIPAGLPAVTGATYWESSDTFRLSLGYDGYGWKPVAKLVPWAEVFGADVHVSLTSYGSRGDVEVSFQHDGISFDLSESIGTAEAYQLGAAIGRPLSRDVSLVLTAAEMRSALALIGGA